MSYPYFFISAENMTNDDVEIFGDDLNHLSKVLRLKIGDKVELSDNDKYKYSAEIINIKKDKAILKILNKTEIRKSLVNYFLFQCILKRNSMELVIQKATEIGIDFIIPVKSLRTVVNEKIDNQKLIRWNKISLEASKQSKRDFKSEVLSEINIKDINPSEFDIFFIPYEKESPLKMKDKNIINDLKIFIEDKLKNKELLKNSKNIEFDKDKDSYIDKFKNKSFKIGYIIGPEGGFEQNEAWQLIEKGASAISLGDNILKAETAAIFMASIIKYTLDLCFY